MVLWPRGWVEIKLSFLRLYCSFRYTASAALGIRQDVEQIMANVFFYSTFLKRFLFLPRLLRFLTFFYFSWNVFYIYDF